MQSKNFTSTQRLIMVAFFITLEVVFTRMLSINLPFLRIGFGFLPIAMVGIMFGPLWSGLAYTVGDVIGLLLFPPTAPPHPGFTLTAFLTGLVFGLVLYKKEVTMKRTAVASFIVVIGLNLFLDTFWLTSLLGQGYLALLPARIIKCAAAIPLQTILIPLIWNKMFKRVSFNLK